jgi:putative protease
VVLARELSLEQIKRLREGTDIELEVFVHGSMCVSYSGLCLLSEHLCGRDANQGACAQSCRWEWAMTPAPLAFFWVSA